MRTKPFKAIQWLSVAACAFVILHTAASMHRMGQGLHGVIPFREEFTSIQKGLYITYGISAIAIAILFLLWIINTWKGIKQGNAFPRINATIAYVCGITYFIYGFCEENIVEAFERGVFSEMFITTDMIFIPLIIFIFATLYKIASITSEDNHLTI